MVLHGRRYMGHMTWTEKVDAQALSLQLTWSKTNVPPPCPPSFSSLYHSCFCLLAKRTVWGWRIEPSKYIIFVKGAWDDALMNPSCLNVWIRKARYISPASLSFQVASIIRLLYTGLHLHLEQCTTRCPGTFCNVLRCAVVLWFTHPFIWPIYDRPQDRWMS